ncbi:MAG TPA: GNAT family N-acetyltransferase [Rectinemataceae bacterium]|nr:GNAT family N-acetyltransferase [Rectinemataceae bacterium]
MELTGLVVDEGHRRRGLGELLMEAAERWTRAKGLGSLRLKTNVVRKEAHLFYERLGFAKVKQQFSYSKQLGPARG